jgi:hypothetical protein
MTVRRIPIEPINILVPALHAFVFDGKYLFDEPYMADVAQKFNGRYVVHLDGVQLDRIQNTPALKTLFPRVATEFQDDRAKILMIDFAFYILQGHGVKDGFIVVPINQQMTDLRATNLMLLPGNDRKLYRCTDIVPRDGLDIGGFLPRSVTIIKLVEPDQYQFKISRSTGGPRKVIGFDAATSAQVFRDKVMPLLHLDGFASDAIYQDLCASYIVAFPFETTTELQPKLKKRKEVLKDDLRDCKKCKRSLPFISFEGKSSECKSCREESARVRSLRVPESVPKPVACIKCSKGPDVVAFKWRSDRLTWRNECNSCYNTKGYCEASRARRREEDEEGYLRHNAETHLAWAHKNPVNVKVQQRLTATVPERKFKTILTSAKQRGIDVNTDDIINMQIKLSLECEYCGFVPHDDESLNGLDRVNSDLGYTSINTVPCCASCNAMKGPLDTDVFITNVRNVYSFAECNNVVPVVGPRVRMPAFGGRAELREAPKKEKKDFLTGDNKFEIWSSPCYLCGQSPSFGIDRVDANGDYTIVNSKPCCTECNYMKKDMILDDFKAHIAHIFSRTRMWTLGDVTNAPLKMCGGRIREPVAVSDNNGTRIIFPSRSTADKMIGFAPVTWHKASVREFRLQKIDPNIGRRIRAFFRMFKK